MVLSWGKPLLEICMLDNGVIPANPVWMKIDTPVMNSTQLTSTEGTKREAQEEGGAVVDSYREKNKLTLTFELYAKKGFEKPIEDEDGAIVDNYAIRLTPEDPMVKGFVLPNCSVACGDSFDTENGEKWLYTFDCLKPLDGGTMKQEYFGVAARTRPATGITNTDAVLNGTYSTRGTVTGVGFSYKEKSATSWTDVPVSVVASPFSQTLTSLTAATVYEFKAYAAIGASKYEGNVITFTTKV